MAYTVTNVRKTPYGLYYVTVQDSGEQIGTDEFGKPIYRTYTAVHNPKNGIGVLKNEIKKQIQAHKAEMAERDLIKSKLQAALDAI